MKLHPRLAASLLVLAVLTPPLPAAESKIPDLQGTWRLNEDVTYRMNEGLRNQRPRGGGPRLGGARRRPSGGGGPGGPGGGPGGRSPRGGPREGGPPRIPFEGQDEVTITQSAEEVVLTFEDGQRRVLRPDGKKRDDETPAGPAEVRTSWKDGSLVVQVKPGQGPKRTESWTVSNDRKLLYLTVTIDGPRGEISLRRAYDAVAPEKEPDTTSPME